MAATITTRPPVTNASNAVLASKIELIQTRPKDYKLDQAAGALRFNMDMSEPTKRIAQVETLIGQLAG
jgi:hypothetical protein